MNVARITDSVGNYDEIVKWQQNLASASSSDEFYDVASGLVQVYGRLAKKGILKAADKKGAKIAAWLRDELSDFWDISIASLSRYPAVASSVALKIILIKGKYAGEPISQFVHELLVASLLKQEALAEIQSSVIEYDDLRFHVYSSVPHLDNAKALIPLLSQVEKVIETDRDFTKPFASLSELPLEQRTAALKYRNAFQHAWLHLLRQPSLDRTDVKEVLTVMHARIIPNMTRPQLLMDFLVDAYEYGGAISLLALNALFVLIQYHQLDYPHFFTKLYQLLEEGSILVSAHRARFLRLLDLFLTSSHMPATIPASIMKRLARLCLYAPPGAIIAILPFVYNQLKRHQTCMVMIHRLTSEDQIGSDPFDPSETNPLNTHAIDSSLWELQTLTNHYHPNVASIARIYSQPFRKPNYQLEHFLSHSYETLYATEYHRKRDREPGLEFEAYNVFDDLGDTWLIDA